MKAPLLMFTFALLSVFPAGCSSGGSDPSAADSDTSKNNFTRPLNDAEKAKAGAAAAPTIPADKKPVGG